MNSKPLEHFINDWTDRERGAFLRGMKAGDTSPDTIEALASVNELRAGFKEFERINDQQADTIKRLRAALLEIEAIVDPDVRDWDLVLVRAKVRIVARNALGNAKE
jgi:hypothetical protein